MGLTKEQLVAALYQGATIRIQEPDYYPKSYELVDGVLTDSDGEKMAYRPEQYNWNSQAFRIDWTNVFNKSIQEALADPDEAV